MSKLVEVNEKIAETVVDGYKKIEEGVVGGFTKMADKFVEKHLTKDGETVEEAKARLAEEQKSREEAAHQEMEARKQEQDDIVKRSLEASLNAGKR